MGEENWAIVSSVVPPVSGFVANCMLRGKDALKSGAADWLLALWVFDLTAALTVEEFTKFIPDPRFQHEAGRLFIYLTILTGLLWSAVGKYVEPYSRLEASPGLQQLRQWLLGFCTYSIAMAATALNTYIFVHGG